MLLFLNCKENNVSSYRVYCQYSNRHLPYPTMCYFQEKYQDSSLLAFLGSFQGFDLEASFSSKIYNRIVQVQLVWPTQQIQIAGTTLLPFHYLKEKVLLAVHNTPFFFNICRRLQLTCVDAKILGPCLGAAGCTLLTW